MNFAPHNATRVVDALPSSWKPSRLHGRQSCGHAVDSKQLAGFTLVELLVVVAIIGILIALLLPAVQAAREAARRMQCVNNLKQIGLALHNYHGANSTLPGGAPYGPVPVLHAGATWCEAILPFIEEQALYDQFNFKKPLSDPANSVVIKKRIEGFICPSDPASSEPVFADRDQLGNWSNPKEALGLWYLGSMGPTCDGCFYCPQLKGSPTDPDSYCCQGWDFGSISPEGNSVGMFGRQFKGIRFKQATDGLSNTLMVGEGLPTQCFYQCAHCPNNPVAGTSIPVNILVVVNALGIYQKGCGFKSTHAGGANFLMADASVQFIDDTIDYRVYNNLGTRSGNETAKLP